MTTIRYIEQPGRRRARLKALIRACIACLGIALTALVIVSLRSAQADGSFYMPNSQELAGKPGSIIRSEAMPFSPDGAIGTRILYRSIGLHGEPVAVSGVLITPATGSNRERPIVAWAHPTSGVATACAPSLSRGIYRQIQGLELLVAQGYAVVATDYPGLGTPGVHPYLIGDSEGRSVLDSVRAARELLGEPQSPSFAIWGHSQGGQAVLYAGLQAQSYAPELRLVGIAVAAPATDLTTLMKDDFATSGGKGLTALTLWSWSRLFDIRLDDIVQPSAMKTVDTLGEGCIETIFDFLERRLEERPLSRDFLTISDISAAEPWNELLKQNTPGVVPSAVPVFIAQGLRDTIVRPAVTLSYVRRLCGNGNSVEFVTLPNVGHGFIARDIAGDAVQWMADRLAERAAPNHCAELPKAGPQGE